MAELSVGYLLMLVAFCSSTPVTKRSPTEEVSKGTVNTESPGGFMANENGNQENYFGSKELQNQALNRIKDDNEDELFQIMLKESLPDTIMIMNDAEYKLLNNQEVPDILRVQRSVSEVTKKTSVPRSSVVKRMPITSCLLKMLRIKASMKTTYNVCYRGQRHVIKPVQKGRVHSPMMKWRIPLLY